ncbi:MAG: type II toxin-antitoxin system VapC family toxin, partial [Oscillospiraceae bacterium]|nr:type II toxin-antitoxin system VapC family toxin [Oscillospiraceae bacterium]
MYIFDTNMCIFIIKKKFPSVIEKLKQNKGNGFCISSITLAEMEYGIENANQKYKAQNRIALME